ncbi:uncharacterized protein BYT42DRAFT_557299 [Radiomyces spectabilis]|uniref:uncharacterized protein n=1 Tax=Radiomyces spectabilis TaxID=64574 RepID=UPI00221FFE3E|nr:uncharacterized protein BYT42DRAFT_557299 [Radiomyces spectabilis]KAI8391559.1 hypothetical protein BYT42DRAFT_557299 [Radiomyces spectabilis]
MNLEKDAQLSLGYSDEAHRASWAMPLTGVSKLCNLSPVDPSNDARAEYSELDGHYVPSGSYSTPIESSRVKPDRSTSHNAKVNEQERQQFLRELDEARKELDRLRQSMTGLTKQMNGMSLNIQQSRDRVLEIEQGLTTTHEVNVNMQVLLEKSVKEQKASDVIATQVIRNFYSDLTQLAQENHRIKGRLNSIENQQRKQKGSAHDVVSRMREYAEMLEEAQGTIRTLQESQSLKVSHLDDTFSFESDFSSRRTSTTSSFVTEEEDVDTHPQKDWQAIYQKNSIVKRTSLSGANGGLLPSERRSPNALPQQGLKMLLDSQRRQSLGLDSLSSRKK